MRLFNEIKETLQHYLSLKSIYQPVVKSAYDASKYPFVCLDILDNKVISQTTCGLEHISMITYQIIIYTQDKEDINCQEIAREIEGHVRFVMEEVYAFKRVKDTFNQDLEKNEYQLVLQYEAYVNQYRETMY